MENSPEVIDRKTLKGNKDLMIQAMSMYYSEEFYPTEIAEHLNIDINELGEYIFGRDKTGTTSSCWYAKKKNNNPQKFLSVYTSIKPMYIKKTESKLLTQINRALDDILESDAKMDTKALKELVDSMEKIDKIGRLEDGRATGHTISEVASFSLKDIMAKKKDEESIISDVEYREVDSE